MYECPKLSTCEKLKGIRTIDPNKYDIRGLVGDICWLCDENPENSTKVNSVERFSEKVEELRWKMGWSQDDLARHMYVSLSTIQRWELKGGKPQRLARKVLRGLLRKAGITDDFEAS